VPEKPPMLEMLMTDWASIPGFTHRVRGFALTAKSEPSALAMTNGASNDTRMKNEPHATGNALPSQLLLDLEYLIYLRALNERETELSLSM